jgi:tyrosine-protein phosphatase SIW14
MNLSRGSSPFLSALCILFSAACVHPSRNLPAPLVRAPASSESPAFAEKTELSALSGVGKVNDFLYRGSQPNAEGVELLRKLGITVIVDLRGERQGTVRTERRRAAALGMRLVNIRASGWSPPKDEQLVQFFSLLQQRPQEKIYVHCWLGDDRTGVFLAAYRMAFERWTPERALQEMYFFHFKGFWHPSMKTYVRNFPAHFSQSPAFAPFRASAQSAQ